MPTERLREIVATLGRRPGHATVAALIRELLINGLNASDSDVDMEKPLPEVKGRLDALLGRTVFEFKSDLRTERSDAESQLLRYLPQREKDTGELFVGIATDGAAFIPYHLRQGQLVGMEPFTPSADDSMTFLAWLGSIVVVEIGLTPDPETVRRELGRQSVGYGVARTKLGLMWSEVKDVPDVRLKRDLWSSLLEQVYGTSVDSDELFFQHTYLTIVAKSIANSVLGVSTASAHDLLNGRALREAGIAGAIESDFFDWVLEADQGPDLVTRIASHLARFKLQEVQTDVLKGLYESLVYPEQRHDLGEYYTPDWLASRMCDAAIEDPLSERVLDPACGSGTFLFHSIRKVIRAATDKGLSNAETIARCCDRVIGVDVHPVAVLIARVTYLLAIGPDRLAERSQVSIPVYLGDSLQWNTVGFMMERHVLIEVPDGPTLHFPASVAEKPFMFDSVVQMMLSLSGSSESGVDTLKRWASETYHQLHASDIAVLVETFKSLWSLRKENRDHIWGFVARNLSRPIWLSSDEQQADVVIGNPPWLSYRYMSRRMQQRFRAESERVGVCKGGKVATHQDLSAYFFARCLELYLKHTGRIAFVMPFAAVSRQQFEGFRTGWFGGRGRKAIDSFVAQVRFTDGWTFDENVQPLFPVPSAVVFAAHIGADEQGGWPNTLSEYKGTLPRRDATPDEADKALLKRDTPGPLTNRNGKSSPYRDLFRQGATVVPRMLFTVIQVQAGWIGSNRDLTILESRRTNREKSPWKELRSLRGNVEARFVRPLYLGESLAPFRLLEPVKAIIPWDTDSQQLFDSETALRAGRLHLAEWLRQAESLWDSHGRGTMLLKERLDYFHNLTTQMPIAPIRVVYTKAGSMQAAAVVRDGDSAIDHKLYWVAADENEAYYLAAVLNSETARSRVEHLQSRGQWGARDFDKVLFSLPIPRFDPNDEIHVQLTSAAKRAEEIAATVPVKEGMYFVRVRRLIRDALKEDGIAKKIDQLVAELLDQ